MISFLEEMIRLTSDPIKRSRLYMYMYIIIYELLLWLALSGFRMSRLSCASLALYLYDCLQLTGLLTTKVLAKYLTLVAFEFTLRHNYRTLSSLLFSNKIIGGSGLTHFATTNAYASTTTSVLSCLQLINHFSHFFTSSCTYSQLPLYRTLL